MALNYRADIDGLRAIAVVSVIAYHAEIAGFSGGFVGVDIFFVISGYLISSIIFQEIQQNTFSFKRFYLRRARRIFPALFLVMLVSWPLSYYWLLPEHFEEFSNSLIYVTLFVSNLFFANKIGYFDSAIDLKPLIHTWSLAVEEQYYLLFPVFLLLFSRRRKHWLLILGILLSVISFGLAQWEIFGKSLGFYIVLTRVWEFFAGFFVTLYLHKYPRLKSTTLAGLGMIFLLFPIILLDENVDYPGLYTLYPVLGSVLLILHGNTGNWIYKVLTNRLIVSIGLMSYSLYLWHQPVLAYYRYVQTDVMPQSHRALLLGLIFILSWLSWKYVETPFRNRQAVSDRKMTVFAICGSGLLLTVGYIGQAYDGFADRFVIPADIQAKFVSSHETQHCSVQAFKVCNLGANDAQAVTKVAVLGDSHALAMGFALERLGKQQAIQFIQIADSACPPLLNVPVHNAHQDIHYCERLAAFQYDYLKNHADIKQVFWIAKWASYTDGNYVGSQLNALGEPQALDHSRSVFKSAVEYTAQQYAALGLKPIVLLQVPQQLSDVKHIYYRLYNDKLKPEMWPTLLARYSVPFSRHQNLQAYNRQVFAAAAQRDLLTFINPDPLFCNNEVCLIGSEDTPLYRDADHLSREGALLGVRSLQPVLLLP